MCTAFTVTVDARGGTTTGISAADRALTLRALADPRSSPEDFRRPGHICPLRRAAFAAFAAFAAARCWIMHGLLLWHTTLCAL
jgi:3,4-dihydroxy-2-butanone 4-phosphate synthase